MTRTRSYSFHILTGLGKSNTFNKQMPIGTNAGIVYYSLVEEDYRIINMFFEIPVWQSNHRQCLWPISSSGRSIRF